MSVVTFSDGLARPLIFAPRIYTAWDFKRVCRPPIRGIFEKAP